jgi:hypothetical protein
VTGVVRSYGYRGPENLRLASQQATTGTTIQHLGDLEGWLAEHAEAETEGATFVVMLDGALRLAARRTEHVACARGEPVLAAGEVVFARTADGILVSEMTNQSTGYCPKPESWPAVAAALRGVGLVAPDGYTRAFVFRHCSQCNQLNIVKDDWFYCAACGTPLHEGVGVGRRVRDPLRRQPRATRDRRDHSL